MKTDLGKLLFDKKKSVISFDDEVVVDISHVPQNAKTKIYSGVTIDFNGYETEFTLNSTGEPFNIQITSFSPTDLIQAIVENRLEVEGMVVTKEVHRAYDYLWDNGFCQEEL